MNQPRAELEFTNRATVPCQMEGWPSVQMLDAQGAALPTRQTQATTVYLSVGEELPMLAVLQPGGHAFFGVGWTNSAAPGPCEYPTAFQVAPPGDSATLQVGVDIGIGSFPEVCGGGGLAILPVQAAPPSGINFNIASPQPTATPAVVEITGDEAGNFCLSQGRESLKVDFSGGSPPALHVVATGMPPNADVQVDWGSPYQGGSLPVAHFVTDGNGSADAHPQSAKLQPMLAGKIVWVGYYGPGQNASNAKPAEIGLARSC